MKPMPSIVWVTLGILIGMALGWLWGAHYPGVAIHAVATFHN